MLTSKKIKKSIKKNLKGKGVRELKEIIINLILKQKRIDKNSLRSNVKKENSCILCGDKEDLVLHHMKPKILGGDNKRNNLVTLCHYCHWYLHHNPKFKIYHSDLVKSAVKKVNGVTKSYKGNKWGRRIHIGRKEIEEIIRLRKQGKSIREISYEVCYLDKNKRKRNVAKSTVYKIIHEELDKLS